MEQSRLENFQIFGFHNGRPRDIEEMNSRIAMTKQSLNNLQTAVTQTDS